MITFIWKQGRVTFYKQRAGRSRVPSWRLVGLSRVAGWRSVGPRLHHLVTLLTDGMQPLVLQGGRQKEVIGRASRVDKAPPHSLSSSRGA